MAAPNNSTAYCYHIIEAIDGVQFFPVEVNKCPSLSYARLCVLELRIFNRKENLFWRQACLCKLYNYETILVYTPVP